MTRARGARWPWVIVAIVASAVKAVGWATLLHHRATFIVVLAVGLGSSLLRIRLVLTAALLAVLLPVALAPHPVLLGVGFGLAVFVVLMVVFFAIATALRARDARPRGGT